MAFRTVLLLEKKNFFLTTRNPIKSCWGGGELVSWLVEQEVLQIIKKKGGFPILTYLRKHCKYCLAETCCSKLWMQGEVQNQVL